MDPYAPPKTRVSDVRDDPRGYYALREKFLRHESALRSAAFFYYLASVPLGFMAVASVINFFSRPSSFRFDADTMMFVMSSPLTLGLILIAWGIRTLKRWIRLPIVVLSGIGLLAFPLGTLVNAYVLYLVFCRKGRMVLSDEYRAAMRATADIRPGTPVLMWVLLAAVLALLGFALYSGWRAGISWL